MILAHSVSWVHSVDIAFSRVFSVRIPPLDQIIPEIWLSALGIILVVHLWKLSCFSQQYPPILSADLRIQPQNSEEWTLSVCSWISAISWRAARMRDEFCRRSTWEDLCSNVQKSRQSRASLIASMEYQVPLGIWVSRHSLSRHAKAPTHKIWLELRDKLSRPAKAKYVSELVLDCGRKPSVVFLF